MQAAKGITTIAVASGIAYFIVIPLGENVLPPEYSNILKKITSINILMKIIHGVKVIKTVPKKVMELIKLKIWFGTIPEVIGEEPFIEEITLIPRPLQEFVPAKMLKRVKKAEEIYSYAQNHKEDLKKIAVTTFGGYVGAMLLQKNSINSTESASTTGLETIDMSKPASFSGIDIEDITDDCNEFPYFDGPPDPKLVKSVLTEIKKVPKD